MNHDVQWPAGLFWRVCSHCDLFAITHRDLLVILFFHSGDWTPGRTKVLLGGGEEFTKAFDIWENTNVEDLASRSLDYLYGMSMGLLNSGGIDGVLPLPILEWDRSVNASL